MLPELEKLNGFCSTSLMVDYPVFRRTVSCSTFDSINAMAISNRDRSTKLKLRSKQVWICGSRGTQRGRIRSGDRALEGAQAGLMPSVQPAAHYSNG